MAAVVHWRLEEDQDRVAHLIFDAPGASANVLSRAAIADLVARLDELDAKRPVGLIVRSAKKGGFIAGANIKEFTSIRTPAEGIELVLAGQAAMQRLEDLPFPSVAAIHGFALGGGLELALACTYRVGAADSKLALGLPEVQLGIHPGFGGTVRAVRRIGVRAAMQLMLQGKPFDGARAHAVGLLDRLSPSAELLATAKALIADRPAPRSAPLADRLLNLAPLRPLVAGRLRATVLKRARPDQYPAPFAIIALWRRYGASPRTGYLAEARSIAELMCSPSSRNLVRVFLLQDRMKGLGGKSARDFKRVHVVGAGVMGGDIATWAAFRGMEVTLQDRSEEIVQPALARARKFLDKRSKDPRAAADALARLRCDVSGAGVANADVVIEAIYEDLEAKRALYAAIEPRLKPGALFATNTSSITLEELSAKLADPSRLVGIHFFNPVAQMQLVEIVAGATTRGDVAESALAFTRRLDKLPLPCKSAPGFVVNRILLPYVNEAIFAYEEGIPAEAIDAAGKRFGMPMGPIELADVIGLDVALHVGRVLAAAFGRRVPAVLVRMVEQKKFGRKSGQGFYTWHDGKPLRLASAPPEIPEDLEDRLILPMLNEAVAALRERVVADADLLDAGAIFGTGFAPFRGGPLQYARERGTDRVRHRLEELAGRYGERFRPDPGWTSVGL
ncbi:MAG TPA: 3-hydroxyacyl-CoA dehydrogenase NAD-binding domain-containing protein [Steroidobacteraceae bacterium]|nr:3-hydroxyacyl-CoA dehydrogenase NAD-binding domain-containing protein [Steroidobacteraceae bacterium]